MAVHTQSDQEAQQAGARQHRAAELRKFVQEAMLKPSLISPEELVSMLEADRDLVLEVLGGRAAQFDGRFQTRDVRLLELLLKARVPCKLA